MTASAIPTLFAKGTNGEGVIEFQPLLKIAPISMVADDSDGLATEYGIITSEAVDKDREICDYDGTAPLYVEWSQATLRSTTEAGQELSLGNVRLMHGPTVAGKITKLDFVPEKKQIWTGSKAVNQEISNMLRGGFLTGKSQGGTYIKRWCDTCGTTIPIKNFCPKCDKDVIVRYVARPAENSYVDNPALEEARFTYVKSNGSMELRKFHKAPQPVPPSLTEKAIAHQRALTRLGWIESERYQAFRKVLARLQRG